MSNNLNWILDRFSKLKVTECCGRDNVINLTYLIMSATTNIKEDSHPVQLVINILKTLGDSNADFAETESEEDKG